MSPVEGRLDSARERVSPPAPDAAGLALSAGAPESPDRPRATRLSRAVGLPPSCPWAPRPPAGCLVRARPPPRQTREPRRHSRFCGRGEWPRSAAPAGDLPVRAPPARAVQPLDQGRRLAGPCTIWNRGRRPVNQLLGARPDSRFRKLHVSGRCPPLNPGLRTPNWFTLLRIPRGSGQPRLFSSSESLRSVSSISSTSAFPPAGRATGWPSHGSFWGRSDWSGERLPSRTTCV